MPGTISTATGGRTPARYQAITWNQDLGIEGDFDRDDSGAVVAVHCDYLADSKSGSAGADSYKVKGNLHWISLADACPAEVRLYDRLFAVPSPGARREGDPEGTERDFRDDLNPDSMRVIQAWLEPALKNARPEESFQFERHGYFVTDRVDSQAGAPVFNRTVTLRDSWSVKGGSRK